MHQLTNNHTETVFCAICKKPMIVHQKDIGEWTHMACAMERINVKREGLLAEWEAKARFDREQQLK